MRILIAGVLVPALAACGSDSTIVEIDATFRLDATTDADGSGASDDAIAECSLLTPGDCGEDRRCVPSLTSVAECVDAGTLPLGAACGDDGVDRCAGGLLCTSLSGEDASTCRQLCDLSLSNACPDGETCTGPSWLTSRQVGVCAIVL